MSRCSELPGGEAVSEAEFGDQGAITLYVRAVQVVQEPALFPDEPEEPASGCVVVDVALEVLRLVLNARIQESDLHLCAAGVAVPTLKLLDDLCDVLFRQRQGWVLSLRPGAATR
jgi:hypothetical protein